MIFSLAETEQKRKTMVYFTLFGFLMLLFFFFLDVGLFSTGVRGSLLLPFPAYLYCFLLHLCVLFLFQKEAYLVGGALLNFGYLLFFPFGPLFLAEPASATNLLMLSLYIHLSLMLYAMLFLNRPLFLVSLLLSVLVYAVVSRGELFAAAAGPAYSSLTFLGMLFFYGFLFILARIHYVTIKDLKKGKERIQKTAQDLEGELAQKQVLIQEVHHRVRNNLQAVSAILNLELRALGDSREAGVLKSSISRIHALALLHETLCEEQGSDRVEMRSYLVRLAEACKRAFQQQQRIILDEADLDPLFLKSKHAEIIGLVTNELLNSWFEFLIARKAECRFGLQGRREDDYWLLSIMSPAAGFPADEWFPPRHLPRMLVDSLLTQEGMVLSYPSSPKVLCTISVPLPKD